MNPRTLESCTAAGCTVSAVLGDLTELPVDAIVNAANGALAHGGGLAGAIVRRGGWIIQEESDRLAPVLPGDAVTTGAGALPCRWVIHAVGPRWGDGDEEHTLRLAVRSSLAEAARLAVRSLGLPAISTGIFGYPKREGTLVIVDEVRRWLAEHAETSLRDVRLTAFDAETAGLFATAIAAWRDGGAGG
jgi:O-acetyl-ADP-ribose deacetylase (regulator of RNase III)